MEKKVNEIMNGELYEWALANFDPVLNIHSHNTMSAFWSGTDDDNELPLYNRLCLVIGELDTDHPKFRFSWNFEGKRHDKESVIDDYIKPLEIRTAVTGLGYEEVSEKGFNESLGYLDYDKVDFDKRWDERIRARGRYGNNRGKFRKITGLSKKETKLTAEESGRIQMEVGGVESQKEQDEFYDDNKFDKELDELELSDIEEKDLEETNYEVMEGWKKDLLGMKNKTLNTNKKVSESKNDSDETKGEQQKANPFLSGKYISVFQKFKRDKLAKEKEQENSTQNSSIWDDVER